VLTKESINQFIIKAEYAVRGAIAIRGEELRQELKMPNCKLDFTEITPLNIGNPQACG
jgi:alanine transaminase